MSIVKRAFDKSPEKMLTRYEYAEVSGFDCDRLFVDRFFHNLNYNMKLYITDELLTYIGYRGLPKSNREKYSNMLTKYFEIDNEYNIMNNADYKKFYISESLTETKDSEDVLDIKNTIFRPLTGIKDLNQSIDSTSKVLIDFPNPNEYIGVYGKSQQKHIIVTVRCFKESLTLLGTDKSRQVRRYFVALDEFDKKYDAYTLYFQQHQISKLDALLLETRNSHKLMMAKFQESEDNNKKLSTDLKRVIDKLDDANYREDSETLQAATDKKLTAIATKLNVAVVDRVVQPTTEVKKECFILFRLNNINIDFTHKVVRIEYESLFTDNPNAVEIFRVEAAPNAKIFYQNIREELTNVIYKSNYIMLPATYLEAEFVADVKKIYEERKNV